MHITPTTSSDLRSIAHEDEADKSKSSVSVDDEKEADNEDDRPTQLVVLPGLLVLKASPGQEAKTDEGDILMLVRSVASITSADAAILPHCTPVNTSKWGIKSQQLWKGHDGSFFL